MGPLWRPAEHLVGKSLLKRFASIAGPKGALWTDGARAGPVSPKGISAEGLAWISESLRSGDLVEAHDAMRMALLEAGAARPPEECKTAPGAACDDAPGPAGGANESPAVFPRFSSPGIPAGKWSGPVPPDVVCPQALARLRERWNGDERPDGAAFRNCLLEIITEVASRHGRSPGDVLPTIDIEHNLPSARTAFMCGLIIAELVSGCLGRLSAETPSLRVNITFRHTGAGKILLSVGASCGRPKDRADSLRIGPADLETVGPVVSRLRDGPGQEERGKNVFRITFCERGPDTP